MFKNYYKKFVKKFFSGRGQDPLKTEARPYRDWKFVVIIFFVALAVSMGFNAYMLFQINNDTFFNVTASKQEGTTLNTDGLSNVLANLRANDAILAGATTTIPLAVDPSR